MRVALPLFRTVKLRSFELPTVTVPKSSEAGVTPINGTIYTAGQLGIAGLPAGLPASVYLVPLSPTDACLPSVAAAPVVGTLEPAAGPPGTEVTIRGGGFSPIENAVYLGQGYIPHLRSADGATLVFVVPASLEPACRFATPPCRIPSIATPAGTFQIAVVNSNGVSNRAGFTVVPSAQP